MDKLIFVKFPNDIMNDDRAPLQPFDLSKGDNRQVPAAICFSSGTSGKPKGVMLSHHNLIASLLALRASDAVIYGGFQREVFYAPCKPDSRDPFLIEEADIQI